jgi:hypothetical protein
MMLLGNPYGAFPQQPQANSHTANSQGKTKQLKGQGLT